MRLLLVLLLFLARLASATPVQVPHATAELVAEMTHARAGERVTIGLHLAHEPGWHTYWKNPGDSGMPTRIAWTLPDGVRAGAIRWPAPERIPVGPLTNYGYGGEVLLLTDLELPRDWPAGRPVAISARADWLICKEICLPGGAILTLELPTSAAPPEADTRWGPAIAAARRQVPARPAGWSASIGVTEAHLVLSLVPPDAGATELERLEFFPDDPEVIDNPAAQVLEKTPEGYRLLLTAAPAFSGLIKRLSGVLVASPGFGQAQAVEVSMPYPGGAPERRAARPVAALTAVDIQAAAGPAPGASIGLMAALGLALVGGLILNLMPCVFPVVSIKVLGFVEQAHGDRAELRRHGLVFAAGILVCFWLVAGVLLVLRAGGEALGWGYQLQSPIVISALAALFFVLGLNLSGMFELGTSIQTAAGNVRERSGLAGAFFGGMLATAIATPCTAPFMGAALGFALTQPPLDSMLVFSALALGMGLPYVILALRPALTRWLPRPGRWMESLRQLLAFPLYLTVVWLVWILGQQQDVTAAARLLAALVLVAAALWAWQRLARSARGWAVGLAAAFAAGALWFAWPQEVPVAPTGSAQATGWRAYSEADLEQARGAGPVFVDFTAAWCVTCQVNKRVVLDTAPVVAAFSRTGTTRLRADWTRRDAVITAALARLGRSGVPVYAVYGRGAAAPELLPEVLTPDLVVAALERAAGR
jgi:thiol:disulfide interchange protein DsbD